MSKIKTRIASVDTLDENQLYWIDDLPELEAADIDADDVDQECDPRSWEARVPF